MIRLDEIKIEIPQEAVKKKNEGEYGFAAPWSQAPYGASAPPLNFFGGFLSPSFERKIYGFSFGNAFFASFKGDLWIPGFLGLEWTNIREIIKRDISELQKVWNWGRAIIARQEKIREDISLIIGQELAELNEWDRMFLWDDEVPKAKQGIKLFSESGEELPSLVGLTTSDVNEVLYRAWKKTSSYLKCEEREEQDLLRRRMEEKERNDSNDAKIKIEILSALNKEKIAFTVFDS